MDNPSPPKTDSPLLFSVVVCAYNEADLLAGLLETVGPQSLAPSEYEVIIVDNRSTDNTRAVAESYCAKLPNVRYVYEEQPGLSPARDRGCREARGEYVAYTDQDCKLPPQWLAVAREIVQQRAPAAFGGPYYAFYTSPKPYWFKDAYRSAEHADCARDLRENEFLSGNNMFFRRSVLQALGGFKKGLDIRPGRIALGDDTEMVIRLRRAMPGASVFYDPRLYVHHHVPANRMTLGSRVRYTFADGRDCWFLFDSARTVLPTRVTLVKRQLHACGRLLYDLARTVRRDRQLYPYVQNWLVERAFRHVWTLGHLHGQQLDRRDRQKK